MVNGYSLILPLLVATLIPDVHIVPMIVVGQITITEFGEIISKQQMTHIQSKIFDGSSTSVNGRVDKDALQTCMFGHCIICMIHFILALSRAYPTK